MPRRRRMDLEGASNPPRSSGEVRPVRCAIYTRKSTSEGLDQAFNSLDAQREAGESYIASQKHGGWVVIPEKYDDGGYSGGSIDRPAMNKLLDDVTAGMVDCVVVYKVDRLSRSLLDFTRLMKLFEDKNVHFVSVTQHFNTADSMGRLTLNILLSFAQFEREIIGERTRDKIAAARKKGKWAGGRPVLGYDIDRVHKRLLVNKEEAPRVREIFELYLMKESLLATVDELARRGWTTKRWDSSKGGQMGGKPFDKTNIYVLLTNVAYLGKVRHYQQVHKGEHPAILDQALFDRVQAMLDRNRSTRGSLVRNRHGALLKGILRCKSCNAAMISSVSCKGTRRYRYYICCKSLKRGAASCPTRSVNARNFEELVLRQIRELKVDQSLLKNSTIADAVQIFRSQWDGLVREDQARLIRLVVKAIEIDGAQQRLDIHFTQEFMRCLKKRQTA